MIRAFRGVLPKIAASAFIDSSAQVIGDVEIGERSSIWPGAIVRGDVNHIQVGDDSNVQDNSVVHVDVDAPTVIGNRVTVGHGVVLHGCTVEDDCLIGIGAIVLNHARIGAGAVIGAASLVPEGTEIASNTLVMGVPGKVRRAVSEEERARFQANCENYVGYGQAFKEEQS